MRKWPALAIVGLVCGLEVCISQAQGVDRGSDHGHSQAAASSGQAASRRIEHALSRTAMDEASQSGRGRKTERALSSKDRQVVIAVAMRSKTPRHGERDCSHLVHAIYQRAGLPYAYATSDDLYDGAQGFQRVSRPKAGDLVVWRGHVGIVIRPSRHAFFSFLHAGPGLDDYRNRYWKGRGEARFYRYLKNAGCAGCTLARGRGE